MDDDKAHYQSWRPASNDYCAEDCPNCGRHRLMKLNNGKTACEKCAWIVEDSDYGPYEY